VRKSTLQSIDRCCWQLEAGFREMGTFATGCQALRSAYEDLREQAIAGGRAPGLALLLHHGMCEWMEVCSSSAMAFAAVPVAANAPAQLLPPALRSEIVVILAGLFLDKQWEATR